MLKLSCGYCDFRRRNLFAETYSYENELKYVGEQEGIQKGILETARKGLLNGFNIETVVLFTGLDESVILNLQDELNEEKV